METEAKPPQRWQHTTIGRCSKHGSIQIGIRFSENGIAPRLPWQERYPGEFCIRCYVEAHAR